VVRLSLALAEGGGYPSPSQGCCSLTLASAKVCVGPTDVDMPLAPPVEELEQAAWFRVGVGLRVGLGPGLGIGIGLGLAQRTVGPGGVGLGLGLGLGLGIGIGLGLGERTVGPGGVGLGLGLGLGIGIGLGLGERIVGPGGVLGTLVARVVGRARGHTHRAARVLLEDRAVALTHHRCTRASPRAAVPCRARPRAATPACSSG